ncbi:MAG: DNA gyrase inhibitor YacG [Salinisphaeraceae bacterium]|nr:DNA gyrase inhibitor YacG [Salinisphaeraceae bacterium]
MPRSIPCPQCGEACSPAPSNRWRPFCSKRCKMIDLGDWLDESNRIPGPPSGAPGADDWSAGDDDDRGPASH